MTETKKMLPLRCSVAILDSVVAIGFWVVVLGLLAAATLAGANPRQTLADWDNLNRLAPADNLRVVANDAKSYGAKFQSVTDEALTVRLATGEQTFPREAVLRVPAKGHSDRLRNALIGAGLGALGLGAGDPNREVIPAGGVGAAIGAAFLTPVGAAVAAAIPTGGWVDQRSSSDQPLWTGIYSTPYWMTPSPGSSLMCLMRAVAKIFAPPGE